MKLYIGANIQNLRNKKGYTQEELASLCHVSSAAISKWENNLCYPDITTLPVLARIFNISIDELLNFEKELDAFAIDQLIKDLITMFSQSYEEGMNYCKTLVHTYPNSDLLKLKVASSHIAIALSIGTASNASQKIEEFSCYAKNICKQILTSNDLLIRQSACILFSNFCNTKEEFQESLRYIQELPKAIQTVSIESSLYMMLDEPQKANHLLQQQLYQDCANILLYFTSLIELAIRDNRKADAYELLHLCEEFNDTFQLHSTLVPQLCFQYAKLQDEQDTLRLLKQYIQQIKEFDQLFPSVQKELSLAPWFSTIELKENPYPKGLMKHSVIDMLNSVPHLEFLRDHEEYKKLLDDLL